MPRKQAGKSMLKSSRTSVRKSAPAPDRKSDGFTEFVVAHIIHDGSSRNREVATRDGRVESRGREAYLKQYVDRPSSEPARLAV